MATYFKYKRLNFFYQLLAFASLGLILTAIVFIITLDAFTTGTILTLVLGILLFVISVKREDKYAKYLNNFSYQQYLDTKEDDRLG